MPDALAEAARIAATLDSGLNVAWMAAHPQPSDRHTTALPDWWEHPRPDPAEFAVEWGGAAVSVPDLGRTIPVWFRLFRLVYDEQGRSCGWQPLGRTFTEEEARTVVECLCGRICDWVDAPAPAAGETPYLRYQGLAPRTRRYPFDGSHTSRRQE